MSSSTYTLLFLSCFFIPLIIYSTVAVFARPVNQFDQESTSALDEYLISSRSIQKADFINSSAAYMLQVSTTFYFVYWGYNYGLSNIWYICSWSLGIYLFSLASPKLLSMRIKYETLASYLASGRFTLLRYTSAAIIIVSFLSMYYVESYFCVDFLSILANPHADTSSEPVWWIFFLILTFLTVVYSIFGGMRRVIVTDRWQISFAYFCVAVILSYLLHKSFLHSAEGAICVATMMLSLFGILFWFNKGSQNWPIVKWSMSSSFVVILITLIVSWETPTFSRFMDVDIPGPFEQVKQTWGWFTLLGFTILNILWQFCDNSNYQRIASLRLQSNSDDAVADLKRLIRKLVVISPLTWGLGIVLGIAIRTSGIAIAIKGKEYLSLLSSLKIAALNGDFFALIAVLSLCCIDLYYDGDR